MHVSNGSIKKKFNVSAASFAANVNSQIKSKSSVDVNYNYVNKSAVNKRLTEKNIINMT